MRRPCSALLLVLLVTGCRSAEPPPPPKPTPPEPITLAPADKLSMVRLDEAFGELRRRMTQGGTEAPARVVRTFSAALPDRAEPAYKKWRGILQTRVEALVRRQTREDFDSVLEACVGCHTRHAPGSLPKLETLWLGRAAKTSAPGNK